MDFCGLNMKRRGFLASLFAAPLAVKAVPTSYGRTLSVPASVMSGTIRSSQIATLSPITVERIINARLMETIQREEEKCLLYGDPDLRLPAI
jgi:hypothetical protein